MVFYMCSSTNTRANPQQADALFCIIFQFFPNSFYHPKYIIVVEQVEPRLINHLTCFGIDRHADSLQPMSRTFHGLFRESEGSLAVTSRKIINIACFQIPISSCIVAVWMVICHICNPARPIHTDYQCKLSCNTCFSLDSTHLTVYILVIRKIYKNVLLARHKVVYVL